MVKTESHNSAPDGLQPVLKPGRWLVPGELHWEIREPGATGEFRLVKTLETVESAPPPLISLVALPAHSVTCQLFWLDTTDEKAAPDLLQMQCERRALLREEEVWQYRIIRKTTDRLLAQVLVLQNSLPSGLLVEGDTRFEALPRCLELPRRSLCVWQSLGAIVLAMTDENGLLYFQSLPHRTLTPECRRDIQSVLWMAEAQGWTDAPLSLALRASFAEKGTCLLSPPRFTQPASPMELVPSSVHQLRKVRHRQSQIRRGATIFAALYVVFIVFQAIVATSIQISNKRLQAKFDTLLPEMTDLQHTARQMDALNPALDTQTYPLEIFHRVMALLPESGVRLTRFEIIGNRVELAGESSTAREAFDFQSAIQSSPSLNYITWEAPPQPVPLPNDTTRFSIQGTITGAYLDAEES